MEEKKKNLKPQFIAGGISFAVGIGIFCLKFFLSGIGLISATDGCALAAVALLGSAGLIYISRNGFFDIFSYGFKQLGSQLFGRDPHKYNDFPGYKEDKRIIRQTKSKYYIAILIVGGIFLAASIVLLILTH